MSHDYVLHAIVEALIRSDFLGLVTIGFTYRHVSTICLLSIASSVPQGIGSLANRFLQQEPPKAAQLAFLKGAPAPPRRALCVVQVPLPGAGYVYEADVLLSSSPAQVVGWRKVHGRDLRSSERLVLP